MSLNPAQVNLKGRSAVELKEIRDTENSTARLYDTIGTEGEVEEKTRITELLKMCIMMRQHRSTAASIILSELSTSEMFTSTEKAIILKVATDHHPDTESSAVVKAIKFTSAVAVLFSRTAEASQPSESSSVTELLAQYAP